MIKKLKPLNIFGINNKKQQDTRYVDDAPGINQCNDTADVCTWDACYSQSKANKKNKLHSSKQNFFENFRNKIQIKAKRKPIVEKLNFDHCDDFDSNYSLNKFLNKNGDDLSHEYKAAEPTPISSTLQSLLEVPIESSTLSSTSAPSCLSAVLPEVVLSSNQSLQVTKQKNILHQLLETNSVYNCNNIGTANILHQRRLRADAGVAASDIIDGFDCSTTSLEIQNTSIEHLHDKATGIHRNLFSSQENCLRSSVAYNNCNTCTLDQDHRSCVSPPLPPRQHNFTGERYTSTLCSLQTSESPTSSFTTNIPMTNNTKKLSSNNLQCQVSTNGPIHTLIESTSALQEIPSLCLTRNDNFHVASHNRKQSMLPRLNNSIGAGNTEIILRNYGSNNASSQIIPKREDPIGAAACDNIRSWSAELRNLTKYGWYWGPISR